MYRVNFYIKLNSSGRDVKLTTYEKLLSIKHTKDFDNIFQVIERP